MKSRNKFDDNKYLLKSGEINNYKINDHIMRTEGNRKSSPQTNNKNRSKSNSKSYKNGINSTNPNNRTPNKSKSIFNQNILEIIRYAEEELGSLDSEKHIKSAVSILESFQNELIKQLEQEYDENSIKKVLQTNFDKIIKLLINYFTLYDKKCDKCITNLKKMLKNIMSINLKLSDTNYNNNIEESSSNKSNKNNYNYNYNNAFFDEEKKRKFLDGEETIVGLINSLSGGIKTCNKNYRTSILDMAKLIEESNNSLVELKNKLDNLSNQLKSKYIQDIQYKKNINSFMNNIINNVENLYSMNINIIEDVKLLDGNQTTFYEEAKEIFNNLKINHSKKLKEYHKLFESISNMQSNANSSHQITKKRGKSMSGYKTDKEKYNDYDNYEEGGRSDGFYNIQNKMNKNNSSKNFNIKSNYNYNENMNTNNNISENMIFNENTNNITIYVLSEEVLEFFNKMKNLQECIVKKISGINQMKIDFERYKKKLIKLLNNIIKNKNNNINSRTKLTNNNDNDTIIMNNKNNNNSNSSNAYKSFTMKNKIINVQQFQIIQNNNNNNININNILDNNDFDLNNKNEDMANELQNKYNNLLEDLSNKNQELNKLQEKINTLLSEKNELSTKNKKLEKDNQKLLSKGNIDEIISSSNNINNNSINSNQELFKTSDNEMKLKQENKSLKELINKCVHIISESIKETSPSMIEDNMVSEESEDKIKNNKNNQEENDEEDEFDMEYITEAVKKFQSFNQEIAKKLKTAEEEKEKYEKEAHNNLIKAEGYKKTLDQYIYKINIGEDGNSSDLNDKSQNKRQFTFDGEGEISFKENIGANINNNMYIKNKEENNKSNNINEEINKLITDSNNEENNNDKNKDNNNNEDIIKVNKDLLKVQQNLTEKIKYLEEEIEKNKTTIHNLFIESGNDLYDVNEKTVSMTKYNRLLKLLETEQERNKNLEEKYISFINEITEGLSLNNISNKLKTDLNKNENNKDDDENIEFQDYQKKNLNKKINKNRTYGELNVHNENYLGLLNKGVKIKSDEEESDDENYEKINKGNNGLYKGLKMQELIEENKDLKEKENLLSTQLVTIKQELKETRYFVDELKSKNIELAQEIESQGTLRNQNLIGSLRNCLERLITEMKITSKVKEILIVLLRLASYTDEQIEIIFKYKEKKKSIINIFQME